MVQISGGTLLSFAQFEREVSGERIRDKFAASLKKGMWMGETPPLGYTCKDRKLIIDEKEAKIISFIYNKFLETESYTAILVLLNNLGYHTRGRGTSEGRKFEPKAILRILKNPYYKGYVKHRDQVYPGEHEAIIDENTWNKVQDIFANRSQPERKERNTATTSFLKLCIVALATP